MNARRLAGLILVVSVPAVWAQTGSEPAPAPVMTPEAAFVDVVRVLQSPRCVNCHPAGDAPTIGDDARPHAMQIRRGIEKHGMSCQTCHSAKPVDTPGAPPGAPNWHLPPKETPMVFQGRTPTEICETMKDPAQNGAKDAAALLHHVRDDELVLYGWKPGGGRTLPPLSHADFVARFELWVGGGMPCP